MLPERRRTPRPAPLGAIRYYAGSAFTGITVDHREVHEMAALREDALGPYVHLLRAARRMFQPDELERLVPRLRGGPRLAQVNGHATVLLDPIAATEAIAYDFLSKGGKYSRPFITLAAYDSLTGGHCTRPDGAEQINRRLTKAVRHVAISAESFHKASLVHDDIQDGDDFRYGKPTLHIEHGVATAINVGDYLIGLGYRLVSGNIDELGADTVSDVLNKLADAHTKLSEGQGAELVWRDSRDKRISSDEAIAIYALKTAPAFEAAFYCGLRLAGPADRYAEPVARLARHLGIAFQILNDLQDWQGDDFNKLATGGDVLRGRPTVLWALALEGLSEQQCRELEQWIADGTAEATVLAQIRCLFQQADVFERARSLVAEHRAEAQRAADRLAPEALGRLAHHLIETILEPPVQMPSLSRPSAIPTS